jgi:hypothetical protein
VGKDRKMFKGMSLIVIAANDPAQEFVEESFTKKA